MWTSEFTNWRGRGAPPDRVNGTEEKNIVERLSEPKSKKHDPRLSRRLRQNRKERNILLATVSLET